MPAQTYPVYLPCIRTSQPLGSFFVTVVNANLLAALSYSSPLQIALDESDDGYSVSGHQRLLSEERIKALALYIETTEAAFANNIILAANHRADGTIEDDDAVRWRYEPESNELPDRGILVVPSSEKLLAIVDGQHRVEAFKRVMSESRRAMPLPCSVFLDLPHPYQAQLFATINLNQRPVSKNVTYHLYGFNLDREEPQSWTPEKLAVFLCRKLNHEPESVFKGHIVLGEKKKSTATPESNDWQVSTGTIVEGVLRLMSSDPARDRNTMFLAPEGPGRTRAALRAAAVPSLAPMREMYFEGNDLAIYTILKNFWLAVSGTLWKNQQNISTSMIRKTVGIQACFDLLKELCVEALSKKTIGTTYFEKKMGDASNIDFSDDFFQASGVGRKRIRDCLFIGTGVKSLDDFSGDQHFERYKTLMSQ